MRYKEKELCIMEEITRSEHRAIVFKMNRKPAKRRRGGEGERGGLGGRGRIKKKRKKKIDR